MILRMKNIYKLKSKIKYKLEIENKNKCKLQIPNMINKPQKWRSYETENENMQTTNPRILIESEIEKWNWQRKTTTTKI